MQVLLTSTAHQRYWSGIARDGLDPLVMADDGQLSLSGQPIDREQAEPEIAWATSDLFGEAAPRRQFLGLVRRAGTLRWFQSPAAGFDDPVFTELANRNVRISNAHVNGIPIAEFVMRAVLDHFQAAQHWRRAQAEREWSLHDFREVDGSTWLVIGLGSIGGGVARRARAFGAAVIGCRRVPAPEDPTDRTVTPDQLGSVIGQADVVVLSAPATPATRGLVDSDFLSAMKDHSVLVNVSRGSLVNEDALLEALDGGRPEAAILDVFASEPLPAEHLFWVHPAVTVTPHNAAGGLGRYARQAELFIDNLERYLLRQPLLNDVTDLARGGADRLPD
ncbi:MAG: D-2-hydroxyacid dehydrogenase [Acidimicrobiales bacterium]